MVSKQKLLGLDFDSILFILVDFTTKINNLVF